MAKLDPKSPDAIRIYALIGGVVAGFVIAFFLVVPILRDTCTWFTARCVGVTVQQGEGNELLVTVGKYRYFYDGVNYVYAYGDNLPGQCPDGIVSNVSPVPLPGPTQANFCFRWKPTPDDPECQPPDKTDKCAACVQTVAEECATACAPGGDAAACDACQSVSNRNCVRFASPVAGTSKFTCNGTDMVDAQVCCNYLEPCDNVLDQCVVTELATQQPDGSFVCARGRQEGSSCNLTPQYVAGKGFTCDNGSSFSPVAKCCLCTKSFTPTAFTGAVDAAGAVFQPVYTLDAGAMALLPVNSGVACGLNETIVATKFANQKRVTVPMKVPLKDGALDVYQVFNVLKQRNIFKAPR